jgi:hypothetical protein
MTMTQLTKICIHQLVGTTCDRSKLHQLSVTGNQARSFSLFHHPSDSESVDTEFEYKRRSMMFGNDSDLPWDVIVANFLGLELDSAKANDDGNLSSTAMAKSLDNNKLELVNANGACDT